MQSSTNEIKSNYIPPKNNPIVNSERKRNCKFGKCKGSSLNQDAMRIYRKYLAKDILKTVCISEELKADIEKAVVNENPEFILKYLSEAQKIIYKVLEDE